MPTPGISWKVQVDGEGQRDLVRLGLSLLGPPDLVGDPRDDHLVGEALPPLDLAALEGCRHLLHGLLHSMSRFKKGSLHTWARV